MVWGDFAEFLKWLLAAWMLAIAGIILVRMLSGQIILAGLLRLERNAPFGLDRLQLVAVTLLFAGGYVLAALTAEGSDLPEIPAPLLLVLIGSHGTYLTVKYTALRGVAQRGK